MTADNLSPYECDWSPFFHCDELTINRHSQLDELRIRKWMRGLDIVFAAETFYCHNFPIWAREEGVVTVLACNPEFAPWGQLRDPHTPIPDVVTVPSTWKLDSLTFPAVHLPFPVDRDEFPFRLRTSANKFVHVAGHKAAADRAGTRIVIGAMARTKVLDIVVRSQSPLGYSSPSLKGRIEERNVYHPRDLYDDADVVVLPRRYGGNSLVHQEALSSGCPVVSLDRSPENTWGGVTTVNSTHRQKLRTKGGLIEVSDIHASFLARKLVELSRDDAVVESLSRDADAYAETISWTTLLPVYNEFFEAVKHGNRGDDLRRITSALRPSPAADPSGTPA